MMKFGAEYRELNGSVIDQDIKDCGIDNYVILDEG